MFNLAVAGLARVLRPANSLEVWRQPATCAYRRTQLVTVDTAFALNAPVTSLNES